MALLKSFNEADWRNYFELRHQEIENSITAIYHENESYVAHGLSAEALYTDFADYKKIFSHPLIKSGETFIDVGAGVGKGTLLARALGLNLRVLSLELVRERHLAGVKALERHKLATDEMILCDLMSSPLPKAQHYFLYLPTGLLLSKILRELKEYAQSFSFYVWVIESHGDLIPTLRAFAPQLQEIDERIELASIRHDQKLYLFKSTKRLGYEKEAFKFQNELNRCSDALVVINDRDLGSETSYQWVASLKGISMGIRPDHLQVFYPNREFHYDQIKEILKKAPSLVSKWIEMREQQVALEGLGMIRKIIISPEILIEFSSGKRLTLAKANEALT